MAETPLTLAEATEQMTAPGQMFETERVTINGVEMSVWKHAPKNLRQILDMSLSHAERDFLVYEDDRISFDQHYRIASALAARLLNLGISKGDRIAIASRNLPQWICAFWGSMITGAVVVPLNAWWTSEELAYGLTDSGSTVLFVDEERLDRLYKQLDHLPELTTIVVLSDEPKRAAHVDKKHARIKLVGYEEFLGDVDPAGTPPDVEIEPDDDATMFYTSGTTGKPKGAVGTHRNTITNLMSWFYRTTGGDAIGTGNSMPMVRASRTRVSSTCHCFTRRAVSPPC